MLPAASTLTEPTIQIGASSLASHMGAGASLETDALRAVWLEGYEMIRAWCGDQGETVPGAILNRAILEVASELWARRSAPGGILAQYADLGAAPVRLARDPMLGARPLLAPYLKAGMA
ncbi:hypothetical protein [Mobiluncus porci]|uniref:Phage gp6-like head-tail connector protein n=1 Tax=Mobiluncus porci TaxID=2652278 RepID=A0A7K0K1Y8_9ACTO|nr:hypothetical protein [Mobiluncus porci]MST49493.1 hypothetical protein [Mobiluncus porci]